uniref:Uncharacterized protein n=1 Tax=Dikerogammarus haemobaphes virus 1 TaxID=2704946 RepID=A0A6G9HDI4_9VIRU|nr:hypothetical protein [Dikerogammarus haemobaphes virus 1]
MVETDLTNHLEDGGFYIKLDFSKIINDLINFFPSTYTKNNVSLITAEQKNSLFHLWLSGCQRFGYSEYWFKLNNVYSKYQDDLYDSGNLEPNEIFQKLQEFYNNNYTLLTLLNESDE